MTANEVEKTGRFNLAPLQKFGRSLMLPIASLPAAGLLLRIGQPDMLGSFGGIWLTIGSILAAAGNAIFANLALLFAVGIAIGIAKKADGSTALAAVVGYLVFKGVGDAMSPIIGLPVNDKGVQELINYGVLGGIVMGLTAGFLWQRYYRIQLPPYLAFFGGRRFVPMVTALAAIILSVATAFLYPAFNTGLTAIGNWVAQNAILGGFIYGTLNRLLIPFGLHHILNNPPWFLIGQFTAADGVTYTGDIPRFLHGDPTAGIFQAGFFPIMMFALPAACLAFWQEAKPQNKAAIGGIMFSVGLTSFLTGITEPIEFAFMFVAWPLYIVHAVLTGISMAVANALDARMGFSFSAGLFDFLINWNLGENQWMLIVMGLAMAVVYYFLFRFAIRRWNLRTPGREEEDADSTVSLDPTAP